MPIAKHPLFPSAHVEPRHVHVWLPDGYETSDEPHAVLYMHDGQNLFDRGCSAFGSTWEMPATMADLITEGKVRKCIVVGVWTTAARFREYLPEPIAQSLAPLRLEQLLAQPQYGGWPVSEAYVRFLTEELKPYIDATYRTRPEPANTIVMGSSMGGLVSCFAFARRPDVFGGAGCLSTHWPLTVDQTTLADVAWHTAVATSTRALVDLLPPAGSGRRLWFDYGTEDLDAHYAPLQAIADEALAEKGYEQGRDVVSRAYPGAGHNEDAWAQRVAEPLLFLLGEA